jgi:hypothetical protein
MQPGLPAVPQRTEDVANLFRPVGTDDDCGEQIGALPRLPVRRMDSSTNAESRSVCSAG